MGLFCLGFKAQGFRLSCRTTGFKGVGVGMCTTQNPKPERHLQRQFGLGPDRSARDLMQQGTMVKEPDQGFRAYL